MRPCDIALSLDIEQKLQVFDQTITALPGIHAHPYRECLVKQIIDSIRRVRYVTTISQMGLSDFHCDPTRSGYDPLKAAVRFRNLGDIDEAFWQIFISTHFGKNVKSGWELARAVYGGLGQGIIWTWQEITRDFNGFRDWLHQNQAVLKSRGGFGNHHKYQSLNAYSAVGTGSAIGSYLDWIGQPQFNHQACFQRSVGATPQETFDNLYHSMNAVVSFGRTAKFDYLTMIGKLQLFNVVPGMAYMANATGPVRGAKLLFNGNINSRLKHQIAEEYIYTLEKHLGIFFGMQVLEDALCNWQKSPNQYRYFGG